MLSNDKDIETLPRTRTEESIEYHKAQAQLAADPTIIRKAETIPLSAWFIIVTELCERFAFYGASLLFQRYLFSLGQEKSGATAINRGFQFFAYFTAIIGAVIADVKLGKFKTIVIFSTLYMLGLILLAVSAIPESIAAGFGLPGFIISTYIFIAFGTGGIKANVSTYSAEQVREGIHPTADPKVYYDSSLTVESVFRYFYWAINVGATLGQTICPIVIQQYKSYPIAYSIPAGLFFVGIIVFIIGKNRYYNKPPNGSVLVKTWRCMYKAATTKAGAPVSHWLDKAKGSGQEWDDKFVDDLKKTLSACAVFLFYPFYWALYGNMSDNFISQGVNMRRPEWLTPENLSIINPLVLVVSIPVIDQFFFPMMRRFGFRLGPITRITIGFIIVILGFIYATVLQHLLYKSGPYFDFQNVPADVKEPINDFSVWWQMPPYAFIAWSEVFASATGLEFAFKRAAPELKSIVMSLYLLTNCGGSLIGLILAPISKDPYMVILFGSQTAALAVVTVVFWFMFRKLDDDD